MVKCDASMTTLSSSLFEFSSVSNDASSFSETLVNNVYNNYPYKIFVLNSFVLLDSVSLSSVLLPDKSEGVSDNNLLLRNLLTNVSSRFNMKKSLGRAETMIFMAIGTYSSHYYYLHQPLSDDICPRQ